MPKTTMHENHFLAARENQVRFAGKHLSMQSVPEPTTMHKASDQKFGFRITPSNPSHPFAAFAPTQSVHCGYQGEDNTASVSELRDFLCITVENRAAPCLK